MTAGAQAFVTPLAVGASRRRQGLYRSLFPRGRAGYRPISAWRGTAIWCWLRPLPPISWPRWPMGWPTTRLHRASGHQPAGADRSGDEPGDVGQGADPAQSDTIEGGRHHVVGPGIGEMAEAGERGEGRMSEPAEIAAAAAALLRPAAAEAARHDRPLAGRRAIVTSGPTHEPIDPVRYIANRSSAGRGTRSPQPWQSSGRTSPSSPVR